MALGQRIARIEIRTIRNYPRGVIPHGGFGISVDVKA